jgi:hypothetical protein
MVTGLFFLKQNGAFDKKGSININGILNQFQGMILVIFVLRQLHYTKIGGFSFFMCYKVDLPVNWNRFLVVSNRPCVSPYLFNGTVKVIFLDVSSES